MTTTAVSNSLCRRSISSRICAWTVTSSAVVGSSAITPIVTLLGLDIGILLGGAILTETVFNIQGIGRFAYEAIVRFDLPVIQGTVLFGAFFIVIMSLIVDILYAFIDPRVRY